MTSLGRSSAYALIDTGRSSSAVTSATARGSPIWEGSRSSRPYKSEAGDWLVKQLGEARMLIRKKGKWSAQ